MTDAEFRSLLYSLGLLSKRDELGSDDIRRFVNELVFKVSQYTNRDIAEAAVHDILIDLIANENFRLQALPDADKYISHRLWQRVQELEMLAGSVSKWEDLNHNFWRSIVGPNSIQQIIEVSEHSIAYGAKVIGAIRDPDLIEAYNELSHHERTILGYLGLDHSLEEIAKMVGTDSEIIEEKIITAQLSIRNRYQLKREGIQGATIIQLPKPSIHILETWKEIVKAIAMDIKVVDSLHWKRFEDLVGHLLESFGWTVEPMGYTKDGGIDLIAVRSNAPDISSTMIVQCKKKASSPVGISHVRELFAIKAGGFNYNHAMIATSSSFTHGAKNQAALWNLELRDRAAILDWCKALVKGQ